MIDPIAIRSYEQTYGAGLVRSSQALTTPWLAGVVHVFEDVPAQPEAIRSPGVDMLQLLLIEDELPAREWIEARAPHVDGVLPAGSISLYPPEIAGAVTYSAWTAPTHRSIGVMLCPELLAGLAREAGRDLADLEFLESYGLRDEFVAAGLRALGRELRDHGPNGRLYADQLLTALGVYLVTHYTARGSRTRIPVGGLPPAALRRCRDYAAAHLADAGLGLSALAGAAGYSPWHFSRALRASTGETPAELIRRLRTDRAAELLRARPRPTVAQVARAVGYASTEGFSRAFNRRWGVGPGQWGK